ncbi:MULTISPECIES: glycoside hydrolase family 6 protein [unclassified Mycobacteroides]|uniref:glycoside hydrolase family 6 protein n=1 Tax=unclassified Mycobacteroides TaxID=2618759 RepID=UPI001396B900|nr:MULTISPECIES: glycoside hydrolase family 6 protein [unclassified Mycobacteroides]
MTGRRAWPLVRCVGLLVLAAIVAMALPRDSCRSVYPRAADTAPRQLETGPLVAGSLIVESWVREHPDDPRAAAILERIARYPIAMWVTGSDEDDVRNIGDIVERARRIDGTAQLVLYNIPDRDDGFSGPNHTVTSAVYRAWIDRVSTVVGDARMALVVEPDALWFADRQSLEGTDFDDRIQSLQYAVQAFSARNARTRIYVDAGTSSGSVTPERMAALLAKVGVSDRVGYALNVSSFAPTREITAYAQRIRASLQRWFGVRDPRYIVDTSQNGNPEWNFDWCNPAGRLLGTPPAVGGQSDGLDMNLWILAPGASNGPCGNITDAQGGEFSPTLAATLLR